MENSAAFSQSNNVKDNSRRIHSLDILRSLAIALVFMFHFKKSQDSDLFGAFGRLGWIGVDLFFVLSGYLIGNQIFTMIIRKGNYSVSTFYARRFLRTLPDYFVVLLLYLFIPIFREQPNLPPVWKLLTFTQNFDLHASAFSHAWSLCIEEQFYLFLPLAIFLCVRLGSRRSAWFLLPSLIVLGIFVRSWLWFTVVSTASSHSSAYMNFIYYPTWGRLDGLAMGVGIAAIKNFESPLWKRLVTRGNTFLCAAIGFLALALWLFSDRETLPATAFGFPILALAFSTLLMAAHSDDCLLHKIKIPGAGWLAILSYAFYLLHKEIIHMTALYLSNTSLDDPIFIAFFAAVLSLAASWILYQTVERPFLNLRDRIMKDKNSEKSLARELIGNKIHRASCLAGAAFLVELQMRLFADRTDSLSRYTHKSSPELEEKFLDHLPLLTPGQIAHVKGGRDFRNLLIHSDWTFQCSDVEYENRLKSVSACLDTVRVLTGLVPFQFSLSHDGTINLQITEPSDLLICRNYYSVAAAAVSLEISIRSAAARVTSLAQTAYCQSKKLNEVEDCLADQLKLDSAQRKGLEVARQRNAVLHCEFKKMRDIISKNFPEKLPKNPGVVAANLATGGSAFVSEMSRKDAGPFGGALDGLQSDAAAAAQEFMMKVAGIILNATTVPAQS